MSNRGGFDKKNSKNQIQTKNMKRKILYIALGLLIPTIACLFFFKQSKNNLENRVSLSAEEGVSYCDSLTGTQESAPDLAAFEGVWHAVKYEKDRLTYMKYYNSDNYAEQFSRYASFSLTDGLMEVGGRCGQKVYIKRFPSKLTGTNNYEQTPFALHFKPKSEYVYCIVPQTIIYNGPCREGYDALYIHNDQLVINEMGFFFYFERGKLESDYTVWGTPGDPKSEFDVTRDFENSTLDKVYAQFLEDFPYERDFFTLEELPAEYYSDLINNEIGIDYSYWGSGNLRLKREHPGKGMVIVELTKESDNVLKFRYFLDREQEW